MGVYAAQAVGGHAQTAWVGESPRVAKQLADHHCQISTPHKFVYFSILHKSYKYTSISQVLAQQKISKEVCVLVRGLGLTSSPPCKVRIHDSLPHTAHRRTDRYMLVRVHASKQDFRNLLGAEQ